MEGLVVLLDKHVPIGVENLLDNELEPLLSDSSAVLARLPDKCNLQGILEMRLDSGELFD